MADIEFVIKISEDSYKATCNGYMLPQDVKNVVQGIKNGIPLEQEPILNKIRAEIEQLRSHKAQFLTNDNKVCIDSQAVLDILDKYKAESEG